LKTMEIDSLKGLYFHNSAELLATPSTQIETLIDSILETGKVEKIGASVYGLSEVLTIHERHPRISLFQVPENIADQRLRYSPQIKSFYERGIEFHVRSIFLQGLLLMNKAPAHLSSAQPYLDKLNAVADARKCSPLELCVTYVKQLGWASKFVVGISELNQLCEILEAQKVISANIEIDEVIPDDILDPRKWING
jgi:aryl-alcohol dehydrogenase-like predicted oxidoreductase